MLYGADAMRRDMYNRIVYGAHFARVGLGSTFLDTCSASRWG